MARGVRIQELKIGEGVIAVKASTVRIRYDGFLSRGEAFQSGIEITINLSRRDVIAGLRYGIEGMREGGKRRLRVSPHLAYGKCGIPGKIPPDAVLVFEVELREVLPHREPSGSDSD